jgi:hypothetical protein
MMDRDPRFRAHWRYHLHEALHIAHACTNNGRRGYRGRRSENKTTFCWGCVRVHVCCPPTSPVLVCPRTSGAIQASMYPLGNLLFGNNAEWREHKVLGGPTKIWRVVRILGSLSVR